MPRSDVVTIIYTSGTTGTPKGVMLTQSNIVGELESIFGAIHADENDALLCLLPLQHVLASVINVLVPLYLGRAGRFRRHAEAIGNTSGVAGGRHHNPGHGAAVFLSVSRPDPGGALKEISACAEALSRTLLRVNRFCMRILEDKSGKNSLFQGASQLRLQTPPVCQRRILL